MFDVSQTSPSSYIKKFKSSLQYIMEASTTRTEHGVADYCTMAAAYGGNREGQPDYLEANAQNGVRSHKLCTDEPTNDGYHPQCVIL